MYCFKKLFLITVIILFLTLILNSCIFHNNEFDSSNSVVVVYNENYQTQRYKCWTGTDDEPIESGNWNGVTAKNVRNAAVIRRDTTIFVEDKNMDVSSDTPVIVHFPKHPEDENRKAVTDIGWEDKENLDKLPDENWEITRNPDKLSNGVSIHIPENIPIGNYQVQIGEDRNNFVTVYVIFDPSWAEETLTTDKYNGYITWAYQDKYWKDLEDSMESPFDYDTDQLNYVLNPNIPKLELSLRGGKGIHNGIFGERIVEMAVNIQGDSTTTPLKATTHAYQVVGQRLPWNRNINTMIDSDLFLESFFNDDLAKKELDVYTAERAALGLGWNNRFDDNEHYIVENSDCSNHASALTALIRAMGIPSRSTYSRKSAGWLETHHSWAEAAFNNPDEKPNNEDWWNGIWWKFDSTDPYTDKRDIHMGISVEGNITPIVIDGWGDYLMNEYHLNETHNDRKYCTLALRPDEYKIKNPSHFLNNDSSLIFVNLFVDHKGKSSYDGDFIHVDSSHGYVLNESQRTLQPKGSIDDGNEENNLPQLIDGESQRGIVAGWGFMLYEIPVTSHEKIVIESEVLTEGANEIELYGALEKPVYPKALLNESGEPLNPYESDRWNEQNFENFVASEDGVLRILNLKNTTKQLYILVQLKKTPDNQLTKGTEVAFYNLFTSRYPLGDLDNN
ncbi:transglutaminase domain-containing protein [Herbivorax sp. ANBcel31]|uniref:transglutaminase domain-containing protein n=1 Tax=Herbivorax sp. ANBcel31 TaxID=3069754 RepID=UPI0027B15D13|nr:transglutaminase domain-containing protein [Herbivorax sp. ANBcel31]MDQ2087670.1 transglutaminase domain-containing protein [Herbivorax sp. ANBcel31]